MLITMIKTIKNDYFYCNYYHFMKTLLILSSTYLNFTNVIFVTSFVTFS